MSRAPGCRRGVLARALLLLLCVAVGALSPVRAADGEQPPTAGPWPFAEGMERRAPLQKIPGVPGSASHAPCADAPASAPRYAAALKYAREMGSYSLLIWRGGRCELAHYFPPYDSELRPESASMHKTVLALLVSAALADGHIGSVDDPVGRYLAPWRDDPRGEITLRDLLTMSSGLAPFSRAGGVDSPGMRFVMGEGDARALSLSRPLRHPPGTVFDYGGLNTQLALQVLEAATGESYADYLQRRLWQPLGADDAWVWVYEEPPGMPRAYTALLATARDWMRIGLLLKNRGAVAGEQLIPARLIDAMTTPSAANPNYGWQIWLGTRYEPVRYYSADREGVGMRMAAPFVADDMIYLDGIGGQRVYISRAQDLVIVRLGDSRLDWDDGTLPNLVARAAAAP